jgi:hypothetical protein
MAIIGNKKGYKWTFQNIGGSARVKISKGEDIAHLAELDPKMWTVLSCPVTGLEIDAKSLAYMDCDGDGKLRINDVVATAQWITTVLKNKDLLLEGKDSIELSEINQEDACGQKLYLASKQILEALDKRHFIIGEIAPAVRSKHVQYIGKLLRPNVEIYTYAESYVNDNGDTEKFIPDNKVVVACDDIFEIVYGAVTQMENGEHHSYAGELVPKYWVNEGDDNANVRVTSKPIPVPFDVNAWGTLTVE